MENDDLSGNPCPTKNNNNNNEQQRWCRGGHSETKQKKKETLDRSKNTIIVVEKKGKNRKFSTTDRLNVCFFTLNTIFRCEYNNITIKILIKHEEVKLNVYYSSWLLLLFKARD